MLYLKVVRVKFEETDANDLALYIGRFSRAQLEELLKSSGSDVFSAYFNQDALGKGVRLSLGVNPMSGRDNGFEPCPPFSHS